MKKFKFNLERVLRVRKIQESLRLAEQRRAERALNAQKQKLDLFVNERDVQCRSMESAMSAEFRIADKQTDWTYLQRIERIVGFQGKVVQEFSAHHDEAKRRFIVARQRSLGLEKLGDKKREAWKKELLDLEQKIADDRNRMQNGSKK